MRRSRAIVACALVLGIAFARAPHAEDITVFAAASLKEAMDEQARRLMAGGGGKVTVSYGASNALAAQIEQGAPADVFVSADVDWMDHVEQRRLLEPGTRVRLLTNTLVLIAPKTSAVTLAITPGFPLAAALRGGKLAMANPDSVPAGKYGRAALASLGVWSSVERAVARAENVRAALLLVARGEAPLGIVYETDARAESNVRIVATFPAKTHPPIVYPAAVIATPSAPAAKALLDALQSPAARAVWARYGFGIAQ